MFLAADHLIEKVGLFNKAIKKQQKKLTQNNIFIFGIKPTMPSSEFGYFLTRNNKVSRFVEKPKEAKAKQIIKKKGVWILSVPVIAHSCLLAGSVQVLK